MKGGVRPNSGRKSAYAELARATEAHKLLFVKQNQEEIEQRISSGKFSILDRLKLTAMEGDSRILAKVLDKAVPDAGKGEKDTSQPITINIVKFTQNGLDTIEVHTSGLPAGNP